MKNYKKEIFFPSNKSTTDSEIITFIFYIIIHFHKLHFNILYIYILY